MSTARCVASLTSLFRSKARASETDVAHWQRQAVSDARIRKIAAGKYARVLNAAMQPIKA